MIIRTIGYCDISRKSFTSNIKCDCLSKWFVSWKISSFNNKFNLGVGVDELNAPVALDVVVLYKGEVVNPIAVKSSLYKVCGKCVTVHVKDTNVDIIVSNDHKSYQGQLQFEKAGISDWKEYDCVVVKQGYIFPELKEGAKFYVMSLTDGPTPQNTAKIPFKLIMRPMYPIDNI